MFKDYLASSKQNIEQWLGEVLNSPNQEFEQLYESMNYRGIEFSVPILPFLFTVGISVLVCTMIPVLTWIILEKNGTVVERIKGVE